MQNFMETHCKEDYFEANRFEVDLNGFRMLYKSQNKYWGKSLFEKELNSKKW
jgi:hypothetical protein